MRGGYDIEAPGRDPTWVQSMNEAGSAFVWAGCLWMLCVQVMAGLDQAHQGRLVDALACTGDEGRDRLRKAAGSCQ